MQKDYIKYLGVILDKNLNWKPHIQHVNMKISKGIGILAKMRHFVPAQILRNLYFAFIAPSCQLWNNQLGLRSSNSYKVYAKLFKQSPKNNEF